MKRKRVNPRSSKRKADLEVYLAKRRAFLNRNRICQVVLPEGHRCGRRASQIHHRKGRSKFYLVVSTWMAVCPRCHEFIETKRAWAKTQGYLVNRLSKRPLPPLP